MIGLLVPPDRWTCPSCGVTEMPEAAGGDLPRAIRALQEQHARDHSPDGPLNAGAIE